MIASNNSGLSSNTKCGLTLRGMPVTFSTFLFQSLFFFIIHFPLTGFVIAQFILGHPSVLNIITSLRTFILYPHSQFVLLQQLLLYLNAI
jgi:hypothetical protein